MIDETESVEELSTSDLVKELLVHGRKLVETEVRSLREQLAYELRRAGGELGDEARGALAQAREKAAHGLSALKQDLREQAQHAGSAARPLAMGGVLGHAAVFLLLAAAVLGLDHAMPLWLAAAIVGLVAGGAGWLLVRSGVEIAKKVPANAFHRFNNEKMETRRWMDSTRKTVTAKVHEVKSALSGIEWPSLPASSGDAPSPTT